MAELELELVQFQLTRRLSGDNDQESVPGSERRHAGWGWGWIVFGLHIGVKSQQICNKRKWEMPEEQKGSRKPNGHQVPWLDLLSTHYTCTDAEEQKGMFFTYFLQSVLEMTKS